MKNNKLDSRQIIESFVGIILTIITFAVVKNMEAGWSYLAQLTLLFVCLLIDSYSIWRSFGMKKLAKKQESTEDKDEKLRLFSEIITKNKYKATANIIKMVIIGILLSRPFW